MADQEQHPDQNPDQNPDQQQDQPAPQQAAPPADKPAAAQKPEESPAKKTGRTVVIVAVLLLLICAAGLFYYRSTFSEDTDDAQVDGNIYSISSRISGQVVSVKVEENTKVNKGDLLVEIDPKDNEVALEQAQASLAQAQADYVQATTNVPITSVQTGTQLSNSGVEVQSASTSVTQAQQQAAAARARVDEAKANALKASKDVERYTPLVAKDVISKQQYDAAVAQATADNAQVLEAENNLVAQQTAITMAQEKVQTAVNQARQAATNGPKQVAMERSRALAAMASIHQAQARVDQANLNLQYTRIYAPAAGVINKKNVVVGANLSAGQDLLTIVPLDDLWVTANFKETQLNEMHRCQDVTITVDALHGRRFSGRLTQIGGATGSKLSLFPPENATGNYVKVVQRIPVRIDFTNLKQENGDDALRPGFSVTPTVAIKGAGDNQNTQNCEQGLPERQNSGAQ